jgi:hypothetical protein
VSTLVVSTLTVGETAGRPLLSGVADETFQSGADVHGAATTGWLRSYS